MAQLNITADNPISEDLRVETLKALNQNLSDDELDRLGQIAKSSKARKYLSGRKWNFLKSTLKI